MDSTSANNSPQNEQRFDRGARLTLAAVALLLLWPITLSLLFTSYPTDGWGQHDRGRLLRRPFHLAL
jgi:hypothetical protein